MAVLRRLCSISNNGMVMAMAMTNDRYFLLDGEGGTLTPKEAKAGWHWCVEWDFMLIGPGMKELKCCSCPEGKLAKQALGRTRENRK